MCTPAAVNPQMKVRRIAVGSIYISPRSKHKKETIEHIIETIHMLRAKYNNEIHFCIGGYFNKVETSDILESKYYPFQPVNLPHWK